MDFISQPVWWILLLGASFVFGIYFRWGRKSSNNLVGMISRTGFVALVAVTFVVTGWRPGLILCVAGGVMGFLWPNLLGRIMVGQVPAASTRPTTRVRASGPLGRRAILQDMLSSGITRDKVWGLIHQGGLIAYEDPKNNRISLVRPQDVEALREAQLEESDRDSG